MVKLGWILLIVVAMVVLVESATPTSPTTRKPRSRKAPLSRSLASSSSSSSSSSSRSSSSSSSSSSSRKAQPSSSSSKRTSSRTSGSGGSSSSSSRRSSSSSASSGSSSSREQSQAAAAATSISLSASSENATGVRRNPASLQSSYMGFQATRNVNPGRLREDMKELGLTSESDEGFNNLNVMETANSGRQQANWGASRGSAYNQYSDYEDLLFDEYDQPLQDNKLLAETSSSSSGKFLKSEV